MKNQFTSRIVKFTFAFMFVLIASSCSEDNETLDAAALAQDQINSELSAKGAKAPTLSVASVVYGTLSYSITGDVCLGDPVTISFNNDQGKDDGLFKMSMWGPNDTDWVNLKDYFSAPNGGIITYTFITEEEGDYRFRGEWNRTGGPTTGTNTGWVPANDDLTPLFTVVNCSSCTIVGEEFSGEAVSCGTSREANFTFGSEDGVGYFKMQGGLTNFTGTNATVYVNGELVVFSGTSSDDWAQGITTNGYTVGQRTPSNDNGNGNGSSNRNIRVVGELSECSAVVVRIEWTSSNTGTTMTGGWSVKDGELELAPPVADLVCPI
ncbi:MAG: hypothetical protein ACYCZ2_18875 [Lutibacter sp.]